MAEIIEMIQTASLIHDDVLDESDMRRGTFIYYVKSLLIQDEHYLFPHIQQEHTFHPIASTKEHLCCMHVVTHEITSYIYNIYNLQKDFQ